jgi:hypothetical protein
VRPANANDRGSVPSGVSAGSTSDAPMLRQREYAAAQNAGFEAFERLGETSIGWLRHAHLYMIGILLLCGFGFATVDGSETISGRALLQARSRLQIVAQHSGVVSRVDVAPGGAVRRGDVIVRLIPRPTEEPEWQGSIEAPIGGEITAVHVRPGEQVGYGVLIATMADPRGGLEVATVVRGRAATEVHRGSSMVVTWDRADVPVEHLVVDSVTLRDEMQLEAPQASPERVVTVTAAWLAPPTADTLGLSRIGMTGRAVLSSRRRTMLESILNKW